MNLFKKGLLSPVVALLICTNIYADDISYSIEKQSLKEAIELISKKSNTPYIANSSLLDGKTSNAIKDVNGTKNALDKVLENSGLEAVMEDGAIIIKKKIIIGSGTVLEEISVTDGAYKSGSAENGYLVENITGVGLWGERSLQDTPYSMTIVSQELIENTQANDMAQIFKMNPLTQDGGYQVAGNQMSVIRGFSSNNPIINGMPLAYYHSFTTMEDLERVETISGATGFLYGGGRVGGAVNYVTKKPTLNDKRSIKVGNYGGEQYYGDIDLSGQIDDKNIFGYRINTLYQDGESVANVGKEQKFVSTTFDFKPTDNFTMDLNYAHRKLIQEDIKSMFYVNTFRPSLDVSKSYSADWTSTDEENDRVMSSLKWNINDIFTFRSSFLFEQSNRKLIATQGIYTRPDGLYNAYNYKYPSDGQESKNYSGNIYVDSKFETFNINHLLTTGYSENYQKYSMGSFAVNKYLEGKTLDEIKTSSLPDAIASNSAKVPNNKMQYKNVLIGDDVVFNDQWSALVGFNYATVVITNYSNGVQSSKYDKSELTPTLSLIYKPFESLTTYTTYIESLEQGIIVGDSYSNEGEVLDPLVSKQYEVGAKYSLNENILLTSALFRIEKSNQYSDNGTPLPTYVQDGEQIHQGIELTATGKITDNLTIFGGGTLMDIEVEKSNDKTLEGKKPTDAASKMAKLYSEYNLPFISGLTLTGGAYYTGKRYGNTINTDKIPSYTLYDAGLRYKTKLDKYPTTFLLNVVNLTAEDYWASSRILGDSRSVAMSMKMEF